MYRAGRGALDERIARVIAAVDHHRHLSELEAQLQAEANKVRHMLGAIELAIVMREQSDDKAALSKLWSVLRGTRRAERVESLVDQADRAILAAALEQQLETLRDQRLEIRREMEALDGAAEHLEALLVEKEAWLAATEAPGAAAVMRIAEQLGHTRSLEASLATAIETAQEVQSELNTARMFIESRVLDTGSSREGMRAQAAAHMGIADGQLRRLGHELSSVAGACAALGLEVPWYVQGGDRPPLAAFEDVYSEASWIWSVIDQATRLRDQCGVEIDRLVDQRRELLAGL